MIVMTHGGVEEDPETVGLKIFMIPWIICFLTLPTTSVVVVVIHNLL